MINIWNRRYIGNKQKLIENIESPIIEYMGNSPYSFADLFAGTGVVAYHFANAGHETLVNDTLYSNYVAYKAWFSNGDVSNGKIDYYLNYFNTIADRDIKANYFSDIYGGKYFSINDSKRIGFIRQFIEDHKNIFTEREYFILLASLIYYTDKIANTVGHFEYFLKKCPTDAHCSLENLNLNPVANTQIYNVDANELARNITADVVYIDPPYNARQYVNFYHVLENLARWDKPTVFEGNSMKFKRDWLKSGYSRSIAPQLLRDLVSVLNCKFIVVSYNNTYSAKSGASINKISEEQIISILKEKGDVHKTEIAYKAFNAGMTDMEGHKEFIFTCEVNR